jgi:hypothetical protein
MNSFLQQKLKGVLMDSLDSENSGYNSDSTEQGIPEEEEAELNHSDKLIGVLSEPKSMFEKASHFKPRTIDWLLPVLLLFLAAAITNIIMMSNPEIRMTVQEKQVEQMRKNFDEAVQKGQMSREQADEQINKIQDNMKNIGMGVTVVITILSVFIMGFILFFLMAAIYFIFMRFIFRDEGNFTSVLVASGMVSYITIIQLIVAAILAMAFGRIIGDTSLAAFLNTDRMSYLGWFLAKIDPFSIWAYIVLSIGLAKMSRSNSTGKYFAVVFGVWLIGGFALFAIAKSLPFFRMFTGA